MSKKKILYVIVAVILVAAASAVYGFYRAPIVNIDTIDPMRDIKKTDRIMVFAPHCDDEVLGAGGLIYRAKQKHAAVQVVMVTNGDNNIFSTDLEFKTIRPDPKTFIQAGEVRQLETLSGLRVLGVKFKDVIFLSYPDGGVLKLYTRNWSPSEPLRSSGTHLTHSPYKLTYNPKSVYCGEHLLRDMKEVINAFSPTIIIAPHNGDGHTDHKYAYQFISKALSELYSTGEIPSAQKPVLYTYMVHLKYFPRPKGFNSKQYLLIPLFSGFDLHWKKFMMSRDEEAAKLYAIKEYQSQLKVPELKALMMSFVRKNELFDEMEY